MPVTDTPLRYPGGKTQLSPLVEEIIRTNGLEQGFYCEPFAGGAGIACRLLLNGTASEVWINDVDPAVHAFWHSMVYAPEALCDRVLNTPVTMQEWHRQRAVLHGGSEDILELGFAALFLNRTNRSGILKGGVIGGYDQRGKYPLDCRFHRPNLVRKIRRIALYRDRIQLTRMDAREYIQKVVPRLPRRSLVNIDPPYFGKGEELYMSFYTAKDHAALAQAVRTLGKPWMLTYDDAPEIRSLYLGQPGMRKELNYTAQDKKVGVELLVLSPQLRCPPSLELDLLPIAA